MDEMLQGLYDNNNDATKLELCPTIPISKEKIEEWCDPWKNAHIVDVLGRNYTRNGLKCELYALLIDMSQDYCQVQFLWHALFEGPWMIMDRYVWSKVGDLSSQCWQMSLSIELTLIHSRGRRFARICSVEIDLGRKLILKLKYEGLHSICFNYGKYAHKQSQRSEATLGIEQTN
ncbi:hypothetical protein HKD37_02G005922 [Glycine soja]